MVITYIKAIYHEMITKSKHCAIHNKHGFEQNRTHKKRANSTQSVCNMLVSKENVIRSIIFTLINGYYTYQSYYHEMITESN